MAEAPRDRRERLKNAARNDPSIIPHGTDSGYDLYGCRCDMCRTARAARSARWKKGKGAESVARGSAERNRRNQSATSKDRRWHQWTSKDLETLSRLRSEMPTAEIAKILGRTFYATAKAIERLDGEVS